MIAYYRSNDQRGTCLTTTGGRHQNRFRWNFDEVPSSSWKPRHVLPVDRQFPGHPLDWPRVLDREERQSCVSLVLFERRSNSTSDRSTCPLVKRTFVSRSNTIRGMARHRGHAENVAPSGRTDATGNDASWLVASLSNLSLMIGEPWGNPVEGVENRVFQQQRHPIVYFRFDIYI